MRNKNGLLKKKCSRSTKVSVSQSIALLADCLPLFLLIATSTDREAFSHLVAQENQLKV